MSWTVSRDVPLEYAHRDDRADRGRCGRGTSDDRTHEHLGNTVERVLRATEGVLIESEHAPISSTPSSVRDLLAAGEDVVAYETLCVNLYEVDVRPPADLAVELRQAAVEAGTDPSRAELLLG